MRMRPRMFREGRGGGVGGGRFLKENFKRSKNSIKEFARGLSVSIETGRESAPTSYFRKHIPYLSLLDHNS